MKLTDRKCEPCEGKTTPFTKAEAQSYLKQTPGWQMDEAGKIISRLYITKNFVAAVNFIQRIAQVAEAENHHPDIHLTGYRKLKIDLSTHAIGGLSENDFIVAAKIDELPVELKK
ncbi:MAG TPA: 4a-hydroxytetrahydrobiopterin dehydratase [Candidatus Omnitrophota bacterium]|nr:4a-hydroxytetrahydrobiopterin dehydratase [Candidatus Omnitrophota bacterium]